LYKNSIGKFMRAKINENGSRSDSIKTGLSKRKRKALFGSFGIRTLLKRKLR